MAYFYRAYLKWGGNWIAQSLQAISGDPIYLYAVADLLFIFLIITYWTYQECKTSGRTFWFWPILFFIFGTPAFLLYLLNNKKMQADT